MIHALQKDKALLDDIGRSRSKMDGFRLWWLGQSGFLLQWQKMHVLVDPYLSDSLTAKYANTEKPHIRMTELVIDPEKLNFIDLVTSSHNHTDHLDGETLKALLKQNADLKILVPRANVNFAANRLGVSRDFFKTSNSGEVLSIDSIKITGIPAAHNDLERDEYGNCRYMGYLFQFGDFSIYHSGDTLWRDEIINALQGPEVDIAILPINGNLPERKVAGNLNARETVDMAKAIDASLVIPCHYHMFTFNSVEPDEFCEIATKEQQAFKVLKCGERVDVTALSKEH